MTTIQESEAPAVLAGQIAAEIAQRDADAQTAYLEAIRSGTSDAKGLLKLATAAGIDHQQLRADLEAMQDILDAREAVRDVADDGSGLSDAGAALRAFDEESKQIERDRAKKRDGLAATFHRLLVANRSAEDARRKLRQIEADNWRILGTEDPAMVAQRIEAQAMADFEAQRAAGIRRQQHDAKVADLEQQLYNLQHHPQPVHSDAEQARACLAYLEKEIAQLKAQPVQ